MNDWENELEKAAVEKAKHYSVSHKLYYEEGFKAGARWEKARRDKELLTDLKEIYKSLKAATECCETCDETEMLCLSNYDDGNEIECPDCVVKRREALAKLNNIIEGCDE